MFIPRSFNILASRLLLHSISCLYPPKAKPNTFTCTAALRPAKQVSCPLDIYVGAMADGGGVTSEAAPAPL